jgi:hypothetical protein
LSSRWFQSINHYVITKIPYISTLKIINQLQLNINHNYFNWDKIQKRLIPQNKKIKVKKKTKNLTLKLKK